MADKSTLLAALNAEPDRWFSAFELRAAVTAAPARYDIQAKVVGFDEIAALYRPLRRALVTDLVRSKVPVCKMAQWVACHVPGNVDLQHREKFISGVEAEIQSLDASGIAAVTITRVELEVWRKH
jgi:hypothetical protein